MRAMLALLAMLVMVGGLVAAPRAQAAPGSCPRAEQGGTVAAPPELRSQGGVLKVTFDYLSRTDRQGRVLYCFATPEGEESPTLRVMPGDRVDMVLNNRLGKAADDMPAMAVAAPCKDATMSARSVNIHFHGMNITPACGGDEVIRTVINPGQSYRYSFRVPANEPAGLYWYHPHIHGFSAAAVMGGASGAIVVEGIGSVQPAVAGLPERVLVIRDQAVPGVVVHGSPTADLSVNYVPVDFPRYTPAVIAVTPGTREFWRVLNASADTILDLRLTYDRALQAMQIVALDGVPTGSHDGSLTGRTFTVRHVLIPPAGRAEFAVTMPAAGVRAVLATKAIDTGPAGDSDPARRLAVLEPVAAGSAAFGADAAVGADAAPGARAAAKERFSGLETARISAARRLYFSEVSMGHGDGQTNFYLTVDGAVPTLYDPANPPAITTTAGAVEDWTIENRSTERHAFHMHQIHFMVLRRDGVAVGAAERQLRDTVDVPYWTGSGPYPSVTVRMDFRGPVSGDFVYHCHILDHEDGGMMAAIRVLPASPASP